MDIEPYLDRIDYHGGLSPNLGVLRRLHRRHLLSVPFENLDIHLHRPILLDQKLFYQKIVDERRGGYCYELNGCFAWLLRKLGFKVSMLSARVGVKTGKFTPEFDHMTLLVSLDKRWLADVGFGDSFTEPKQLDNSDPQEDNGHHYKISSGKVARVLSRWNSESSSWEPQYSFRLLRHQLSDFASRNRYQQTSHRSHFTQGRLVSRLTETGRVTLTDKRLILTTKTGRVESSVNNRQHFNRLLAKHFQMHLG